jgi:minor extracellular protease Epr
VPVAVLPEAPCEHANCWAHDLVGWPAAGLRRGSCRVEATRIGVIDTDINPGHEFLSGARIELEQVAAARDAPSGRIHGTAVLSVLAAPAEGRVAGLLPEAPYVVADIFSRVGSDERADVVALLRGLDLMAARGVRVVNLSLAGPANAVLEAVIADLVNREGLVLVAAVGNGGAHRPVAHPAAYPEVIGVTAVDRRGRLFRGAQRGEGVDLAAPGVELLLATSIRGARPKTGTSFAVPFVTAAAALLLEAEPELTSAEVAARLRAQARDLGAEGPDELFGHGLLDIGALCP